MELYLHFPLLLHSVVLNNAHLRYRYHLLKCQQMYALCVGSTSQEGRPTVPPVWLLRPRGEGGGILLC
jgi:hypothetical protein